MIFLGIFFLAFHKSNLVCIFTQLSAVVPVATEMRRAIETDREDLQFTNSDNALRVMHSFFDISVIVRLRGFMKSSKKTSPGCVGFLVIFSPNDSLYNQQYMRLFLWIWKLFANCRLPKQTNFPLSLLAIYEVCMRASSYP